MVTGKTIYHYTNDSGLYGILGNINKPCVWATHFKFLNDQTELLLFKNELDLFLIQKVKDALISRKSDQCIQSYIFQENGLNILAKNIISNAIEAIWSALFDQFQAEIYVVSFCSVSDDYVRDNGLLSQWRGYGVNGGYAIEYDVDKLKEALKKESDEFRLETILEECIYSDCDGREINDSIFSEDLDFLAEYALKVYEAEKSNSEFDIYQNYGQKAIESFLRCAARFKHKAFKEENEVRIAITLIDDLGDVRKKVKERKFRERNGIFVPYITLFEDVEKNPIKKIIVGPHREKDYRAEALRVFLNNKGYKDIDVVISDIPFV